MFGCYQYFVCVWFAFCLYRENREHNVTQNTISFLLLVIIELLQTLPWCLMLLDALSLFWHSQPNASTFHESFSVGFQKQKAYYKLENFIIFLYIKRASSLLWARSPSFEKCFCCFEWWDLTTPFVANNNTKHMYLRIVSSE